MILQKIFFGKMYFDWGLLPREQGTHKGATVDLSGDVLLHWKGLNM